MLTLRALLDDPSAAGLYRLTSRRSTATLRRQIERAGWRCFTLDGAGVADKGSFLRAVAEAMAFPAYFGKNWDALEECLTDLSWVAGADRAGYIVLYEHVAPFIREAPADWAVAREILAAAVDHWRGTPTPLAVLLRGARGLAPDLPLVRA
jgi:barstar (barnase inhibitor)